MTDDVPYLHERERAPRIGRRGVEVRLMGTVEDVERLTSVVMPGFREAARRSHGLAVTVYGTVVVGPGVHDYYSTYCQHEAGDPAAAAGLHALCAGTVGLCGEKVPGVCKVCRAKCQCPQHADDADATNE